MQHHLNSTRFSGGFTSPRIYRVQPDRHRTSRNIFAGVPIRVCGITAARAFEQKTVPVGFVNMTASMTHTRSILGRNNLHRNTLGSSLISNTKREISIRPTVNPTSKSFTFTLRGFSYVRQILKNNFSCTNRISPIYKSLGSNMHCMFSYGSLVSRHSLQELSRRSGSNRLYFSSGSSDVGKFVVQMISFVKQFIIIRVRSNKKSFDTLIHPNNNALRFRFWYINLIGKIKKPLFTTKRYFRIFPIFWEKSGIIKCNFIGPKSDSSFGSSKVSFPNDRY